MSDYSRIVTKPTGSSLKITLRSYLTALLLSQRIALQSYPDGWGKEKTVLENWLSQHQS